MIEARELQWRRAAFRPLQARQNYLCTVENTDNVKLKGRGESPSSETTVLGNANVSGITIEPRVDCGIYDCVLESVPG
ncbi:hypothetical protein QYF36_009951 [Acer negundo]|nr:hypothetical protein QYF36_009951 [Acer negundo]